MSEEKRPDWIPEHMTPPPYEESRSVYLLAIGLKGETEMDYIAGEAIDKRLRFPQLFTDREEVEAEGLKFQSEGFRVQIVERSEMTWQDNPPHPGPEATSVETIANNIEDPMAVFQCQDDSHHFRIETDDLGEVGVGMECPICDLADVFRRVG